MPVQMFKTGKSTCHTLREQPEFNPPLMAIYGTTLLSICLIAGLMIGRLLGMAIGIQANVGGVGIAMLLLIVLCDRLRKSGHLPQPTQNGILFWSSIYIPIVVAMAAIQNVHAAISGGAVAIVVGVVVVVISFAMVPIISRLGQPPTPFSGESTRAESDKP